VQGNTGPQGQQGIQGPPWSPVGHTLTGTLACPKSSGSIPAGFTSKNCTFIVTGAN
jgi:hypothetical protein